MKPMLATKFEDKKHKLIYPVFVQPKLDGIRCIASWQDGKVVLKARSGLPLNVPHISTELASLLPAGVTYDGELYVHGMRFDDISSLVRRYREESLVLEYHVYDCVTQNKETKFYKRFADSVDCDYKVCGVETHSVSNEDAVNLAHSWYLKRGYEGVIVRNDTPYEHKRSNNLQKLKTFHDAEFKIVGFASGKGKHMGCVVWECETADEERFNVTPKTTEAARRQLYAEASSHVGSLLKVKYFEMTERGVPRFPVGLGIRLLEDN